MTKAYIRETTPYLSKGVLEERAYSLLRQYIEETGDSLDNPPIPVELIAERLLGLAFDWDDIPDTDISPTFGLINPATKTIHMNNSRRNHFDQYPGVEQFTIAHEIGHWVLHIYESEVIQLSCLSEIDFIERSAPQVSQYASLPRANQRDIREPQADIFASYLTMPKYLVIAARNGMDISTWQNIKDLARRFKVSKQAMTIRLEELGLIYVNGSSIYPSKEAFTKQQSFF